MNLWRCEDRGFDRTDPGADPPGPLPQVFGGQCHHAPGEALHPGPRGLDPDRGGHRVPRAPPSTHPSTTDPAALEWREPSPVEADAGVPPSASSDRGAPVSGLQSGGQPGVGLAASQEARAGELCAERGQGTAAGAPSSGRPDARATGVDSLLRRGHAPLRRTNGCERIRVRGRVLSVEECYAILSDISNSGGRLPRPSRRGSVRASDPQSNEFPNSSITARWRSGSV